jgi:hypothetical protein
MRTLLLLLVCCSNAYSQPIERRFAIGDFIVYIEANRFNKDGKWLPSDQWPLAIKEYQKTNAVFSGDGFVKIKDKKVPVTFSGIKLSYDPIGHVLKANSGTVIGKFNTTISYETDGFNIQILAKSLIIKCDSSIAKINIPVSLTMISGNPVNLISIFASPSCHIKPDGSIFGRNFYGHAAFALKRSEFQINISQTNRQLIKLGSSFRDKTRPGIYLSGMANRDDGSYKFNCTIVPGASQVKSTVTLNAPLLNRKPETGYELNIKSGAITYRYGPYSNFYCSGSFIADLALPNLIKDEFDHLIRLNNIVLKTDMSGALYNAVLMPGKIKVNPAFSISGYRDSVWIYFPNWHKPSLPPVYVNYDTKQKCSVLFHLLEALPARLDSSGKQSLVTRPGLTVNHGIIYFRSPQIRHSPGLRAHSDTIKSIFFGALTATPYGITGKLTSLKNTFIPASLNIDQSSEDLTLYQPAWDDIISAGDLKPAEPEERFLLGGLRVMSMRIKDLHFCMNAISENCFRYNVHFPWPSYINLEFEDTSLDKTGKFHFARGPIGTETWTFNTEQGRTVIPELRAALLKGTLTTEFPDSVFVSSSPVTKILWAWRLPVTFSDRGVIIKFNDSSPLAKVSILMNLTSLNFEKEIVSSEIWVRPLYSKNSGIKAGVRFSGSLDSIGNFRLSSWDQDLFMAKMYSKPGTEEITGFNCLLKNQAGIGIKLTDSINFSSSRKIDFQWEGAIEFPFFGGTDGHFIIRNLEPGKLTPVILNSTRQAAVLCGNVSKSLMVNAEDLKFKARDISFKSERILANEIVNTVNKRIEADSMVISSFTRGVIFRRHENAFDTVISEYTVEPGTCGRTKETQQKLIDAIRSQEFVDLVCYDQKASNIRGIPQSCCNGYFLGTYQVNTRDYEGAPENTILVAPNTMWFPDSDNGRLEIQNSSMSMSSDDVDNPFDMTMGVPGAQLKISGSTIEGAFGATMATVASELPYEGEFRFLLDSKCGFFYVQAAGSFTYYLRFTGALFVVHAPLQQLRNPSPFDGVSPILDDLSIRALFDNEPAFEKAVGFDVIDPATIITGVLNSGGASLGYDIDGIATLKLAAGVGTYLFQYKSPTDKTYHIGTFLNAMATADIKIVTLEGWANLYSSFQPPSDQTSLSTFLKDSEFKLGGRIKLQGCVGILIGSCYAGVSCDGSYSSKDGFDFSGFNPDYGCSSGDCP